MRDKFFSPFSKWLKSITDGAYAAMMNAIRRDELPSMYFMQYEICSSRRESAHSKSQSRLTSAATFTTAEAYAFTRELEKLHPDNRLVRDKIRQQLQVGFLFARICVCRLTQMPDAKRLRDAGLLIHFGRGVWHLP
jgi:hypothetical protein